MIYTVAFTKLPPSQERPGPHRECSPRAGSCPEHPHSLQTRFSPRAVPGDLWALRASGVPSPRECPWSCRGPVGPQGRLTPGEMKSNQPRSGQIRGSRLTRVGRCSPHPTRASHRLTRHNQALSSRWSRALEAGGRGGGPGPLYPQEVQTVLASPNLTVSQPSAQALWALGSPPGDGGPTLRAGSVSQPARPGWGGWGPEGSPLVSAQNRGWGPSRGSNGHSPAEGVTQLGGQAAALGGGGGRRSGQEGGSSRRRPPLRAGPGLVLSTALPSVHPGWHSGAGSMDGSVGGGREGGQRAPEPGPPVVCAQV